MQLLLAFVAGFVLASIVAVIVLRSMTSTTQAHTQSLIDSERARMDATMGRMMAEMKTTTDGLLRQQQEELRQQQEELKRTNRESVEQLISPLKGQMESMNKLMDDTRSANVKSNAELEGALRQMVEQTATVGRQADKLAEAMKNKGKVHGDWGEQVLDDILIGSGLREGMEYTKQEVIQIGTRESYRPDFIINLPGGGRVIVDSKVSLTAYAEALGSPEDYEQGMRKNYDSVWAHVMELHRKQYPKYVTNALEHVLMFMPNEGAYVMAMNHNPALAQEAYRKGVIILNPTNLMLTLHLVHQSWNGTRQEDNCRRIIEAANGMYDKMVTIVDTCTSLTKQLTTVTSTCKTLNDQLSEGRGNLFKRMEDLKQMGITSTKQPKVKKIVE